MLDAPRFNAWHTSVERSAPCNLIFRHALGLPPGMVSNSLLSWAAIAEVTDALRLAPGQTLADLACGRGGYGREVARRTGARLLGSDFSAVAIAIAARAADRDVRFWVGDFTAVALRDGAADAVMCIDAIQFAEPTLAGLAECRRILTGGGRLAITGWEPLDPADERLPERIRRMDLARDLTEAGFEQIAVTTKPDWYAAERALCEAALRADADGDPALTALQEEATGMLDTFDARRRVLATATAPS